LLITVPCWGESKETVEVAKTDLDALVIQLETSTVLLEKNRNILKQERNRWHNIHDNPVPDEVTVVYDEKNREVVVSVDIDTGIQNEINRQHITREQRFSVLTPDIGLLPAPFDFHIGAGLSYKSGYRPVIGLGLRLGSLFPAIPKYMGRISGILYTTIFSTGFGAGYVLSDTYRVSVHLLGGYDYTGVVTPGFAVTMRL